MQIAFLIRENLYYYEVRLAGERSDNSDIRPNVPKLNLNIRVIRNFVGEDDVDADW